jgi:hypothetical protein
MKRILEIIADARKQYPNDDFFSGFEQKCQMYPTIGKSYRVYNKALMTLDDESWQILKSKALRHYLDHRVGQKKLGFFNQLNESFAYRYLVNRGFENVGFIQEGKNASPDIRFTTHNKQAYCEVKTLGISNDEIDRRSTIMSYDGWVYASLSEGFLRKFCSAVIAGRKQIHAVGSAGLVYVIIIFDDIGLFCYDNYRKQLLKLCRIHEFDNLFVKVGLQGNRRLSHNKSFQPIAQTAGSG